MLLEQTVKVKRDEKVGCDKWGTPIYRKIEVEVIARGCTQIELDRNIERVKKEYCTNLQGIPRRTFGTFKVSTQCKSSR